ncbi:hypothetical protein FRB99_007353 [Tulasnella sp. 403]|nr:hypothetical protein FRB99_007353 [Tulasnella sp. 403]
MNLNNLRQAGSITYDEAIDKTGPENAPVWTCLIYIKSISGAELVWNPQYMDDREPALLFMGHGSRRQEARDQAAHNALRAIGFDFRNLG